MEITCSEHGVGPPAVVCTHLFHVRTRRVGFVENSSVPDDLQAWCGECERVYRHEGDLTEAFRAFNDFRLVCCGCYARIKEHHSQVNEGG